MPLKFDTSTLNFRRVAAARKSRDKWYAGKALTRQFKDKCLLSVDWRVVLDTLEAHSYQLPTVGEHCELRMTVPGEDIGRVIGRFGNTLRHLQEQSGCLIQVMHKRRDDVFFTVQITGMAKGADFQRSR